MRTSDTSTRSTSTPVVSRSFTAHARQRLYVPTRLHSTRLSTVRETDRQFIHHNDKYIIATIT